MEAAAAAPAPARRTRPAAPTLRRRSPSRSARSSTSSLDRSGVVGALDRAELTDARLTLVDANRVERATFDDVDASFDRAGRRRPSLRPAPARPARRVAGGRRRAGRRPPARGRLHRGGRADPGSSASVRPVVAAGRRPTSRCRAARRPRSRRAASSASTPVSRPAPASSRSTTRTCRRSGSTPPRPRRPGTRAAARSLLKSLDYADGGDARPPSGRVRRLPTATRPGA